MEEIGKKNPNFNIETQGFKGIKRAYWNLSPEELVEETIKRGQGVLSDNGAICIDTGKFTGRSPKDRFIVKDSKTENSVAWGNFNIPFEADKFSALKAKVIAYFEGKDVFIRDAYACANKDYQMSIRLYSEYPWSNQFAFNMFLRPGQEEIATFMPQWNIYCAPGFMADPEVDGTRQSNFAVINFTEKTVIIGGTGYTGEIKKGIFSVLNFILPHEKNVLSMHCSANTSAEGDVAVFFGLSGTGKTTLSADPKRFLIGDDEHGWSSEGVFNFEGGCYAKCIDLSEEKEPDIFRAIKHKAILENIKFYEGTRTVNYEDTSITENTRVSYPMYHISNALEVSKAGHPTNIFFLTADAFGVLPPISKLSKGQAMYHFISGYTAKVAGTEAGVVDPVATFSACFGAPFLPLHPTKYAEMLGERMEKHKVKVWLINTGWTGGPFGVGSRMKLKYTRAMITAALEGKLDNVDYSKHKVFGLLMPNTCPDVPTDVLHPSKTWKNEKDYFNKANELAQKFIDNFGKYADKASEDILSASPVVVSID